jgi:GlpG protein
MRQVGTLPQESEAKLFADYLVTLGITSRLEQKPEGWAVWVHDEEKVAQAAAELQSFAANPQDPRYAEATRAARELRAANAKQEAAYRKNVVDLRGRWNQGTARHAPLTLILIVASVLVSLGSHFGKDYDGFLNDLLMTPIVREGGGGSYQLGLHEIRQGEVWRTITPIFIHYGWMHLIFDMYWFFIFGSLIESHRRSWRLALLVLAIAVPSNLAQYYVGGPTFGGMSGVVFGLFGYIWMKSRYDPGSGLFIDPNTVFWILVWFALCAVGFVGNIANWCHGIGLAAGVLLGILPYWGRRLSGR